MERSRVVKPGILIDSTNGFNKRTEHSRLSRLEAVRFAAARKVLAADIGTVRRILAAI